MWSSTERSTVHGPNRPCTEWAGVLLLGLTWHLDTGATGELGEHAIEVHYGTSMHDHPRSTVVGLDMTSHAISQLPSASGVVECGMRGHILDHTMGSDMSL